MTPLTGPEMVVLFWTWLRLPSGLTVKLDKDPFGEVKPSLRQNRIPRAASSVSHDGFGPQSGLAKLLWRLTLPLLSVKDREVTVDLR